MLSAYPILTLPTGNAGQQLGKGSASLLLPLWLQTVRGSLTLYGGGGAVISRDPARSRSWTGGWVALYQFTQGLQLGGEWSAHGSDGVDPSQTGFSVGGNCTLGENSALLLSVGRGVSHINATNKASADLGVQARY